MDVFQMLPLKPLGVRPKCTLVIPLANSHTQCLKLVAAASWWLKTLQASDDRYNYLQSSLRLLLKFCTL